MGFSHLSFCKGHKLFYHESQLMRRDREIFLISCTRCLWVSRLLLPSLQQYSPICPSVGGPWNYPRPNFNDLLRLPPRTWPIVVFIAKTHYNKNIQGTINKGKGARAEVQKKPDKSLQQSSPRGITNDSICEMGPPGKLTKDLVPRVFTGVWSLQHPLPSTYQKSRLPQAKRPSARTVLLAQWIILIRKVMNSPEMQVPSCRPRASHSGKLVFLR